MQPLDVEANAAALGLRADHRSDASFLDRKWSDLSGGEAQRMMIAIALATNPDVLLFDEPSSALDEDSKKDFEELVRSHKCAAILVTHDLRQAERMCHSVWHLVED